MTQNSHSCCSAQPPWKIATAVLRAGLTGGIGDWNADQMDEGQRQADGDGGKARRRMFIGRAMNNQQEAAGQDNFNDDSRQHGEAARECSP